MQKNESPYVGHCSCCSLVKEPELLSTELYIFKLLRWTLSSHFPNCVSNPHLSTQNMIATVPPLQMFWSSYVGHQGSCPVQTEAICSQEQLMCQIQDMKCLLIICLWSCHDSLLGERHINSKLITNQSHFFVIELLMKSKRNTWLSALCEIENIGRLSGP